VRAVAAAAAGTDGGARPFAEVIERLEAVAVAAAKMLRTNGCGRDPKAPGCFSEQRFGGGASAESVDGGVPLVHLVKCVSGV
jgi:hypothetical protein